MTEWQPIETAPRDGTCILLGCFTVENPNYQVTAFWNPDFFLGSPWDSPDGTAWAADYFTHWMPLPEPPK